MSTDNLALQNVTPKEYYQYVLSSTSHAYLGRGKVEFTPLNISTYQVPTGSSGSPSIIEIRVNANNQLLGANPYLRFELDYIVAEESGGTAVTGQRFKAGGAHNLFTKMEVISNETNVVIESFDYYHLQYAVVREELYKDYKDFPLVDGDGANVKTVYDKDALAGEFTSTITDDPSTGAFTDVTLGLKSQRIFCVIPFIRIFQKVFPLMVLRGGITLRFYLHNESKACARIVTHDVTPNSTATVDTIGTTCNNPATAGMPYFKIIDPRFVCDLISPTDTYANEIVNRFRKPSGLLLFTPGMKFVQNQLSSGGSTSYSINIVGGVHSARACAVGFFNTQSHETYMLLDMRPLLPSTLTAYKFRIGSNDYPLNGMNIPTNTAYKYGAAFLTDLIKEQEKVFGKQSRWKRRLWEYGYPLFKNAAVGAVTSQIGCDNSLQLGKDGFVCDYIVQSFSRDNDVQGVLTGEDLSVTPIEFSCTLIDTLNTLATGDGSVGTWNLNAHIIHDQFVQISEAGVWVIS